jgi:protein O-GlcNAc transferase
MTTKRINRNDPCACGSGKKYKRCCLANAESPTTPAAPAGFSVHDAIEEAMSHHRAGRLMQAEDVYKHVLQIKPNHPDALHLLGTIAHQKGEHDSAIELINKALAIAPSAAMYSNLGIAIQAQGNLDKAIECFREALRLDPNHAKAYNNIGMALGDQGKLGAAIESFVQALTLEPGYATAYYNLAITLQDHGHLNDAVECYQKAVAIDPQNAAAYFNLGNTLHEQGNRDAALESFQKALALEPGSAKGHNNLGNVFRDLGKPDISIDLYRKALALDPDMAYVHSNLLFTMLFVPRFSAAEIFSEHLQFARRFEEPLKPLWPTHANSREKNRRLKIGYVSGDFYEHAVASFFEPTLADHDKSQVEVFSYHNSHRHDQMTSRIAAYSDHWIPCKKLSDEALAARIRDDGIDILVDLSGHTAWNRLLVFARKPAPIQATWIGYPSTTGLAAMDYRLTDAAMDPEGMTERYNSETLLRLPAPTQFRPAAVRPPINELPALTQGSFTLACLNHLAKITEEVIELWARILTALPHARLMLGNVNDLPTRQKLTDTFAKCGINEEQLVLHPQMPLADYLTLHHQIDLALDPFPYNGGTTTFHSLSMGVPVVTLAGSSPVTRCGASILANAGRPEFVTSTKDDYVRLVIELANDLPRLNGIRQSLQTCFTPPSDSGQGKVARHLEETFRNIWIKWCDTP